MMDLLDFVRSFWGRLPHDKEMWTQVDLADALIASLPLELLGSDDFGSFDLLKDAAFCRLGDVGAIAERAVAGSDTAMHRCQKLLDADERSIDASVVIALGSSQRTAMLVTRSSYLATEVLRHLIEQDSLASAAGLAPAIAHQAPHIALEPELWDRFSRKCLDVRALTWLCACRTRLSLTEADIQDATKEALVKDTDRATRRRALKLIADVWPRYAAAYAIVECETFVHLFGPVFELVRETTTDSWTLALVAGALKNANPSVRRAVLVAVFTEDDFLTAPPWSFIETEVVTRIDDPEFQKRKEAAKDLEKMAETFFLTYYRTGTPEMRSQMAHFVVSDLDMGPAARRAVASVFFHEVASTDRSPLDPPLSSKRITSAVQGLRRFSTRANDAQVRELTRAFLRVIVVAGDRIAPEAAVAVAGLVVQDTDPTCLDLLADWLLSVASPLEWASFLSSSGDEAPTILAALASSSNRTALATVVHELPKTHLDTALRQCRRREIWDALPSDDLDRIEQANGTVLAGALLLRKEEDDDLEEALELRSRIFARKSRWRRRSLDLADAAIKAVEDHKTLQAMRILRACLAGGCWSEDRGRRAAGAAKKVALLDRAVGRERWHLLAVIARDCPIDVTVAEAVDALDRCSRLPDVVATLHCAFVALQSDDSDDLVEALVSAATTAAEDTRRPGKPSLAKALTRCVLTPVAARGLSRPQLAGVATRFAHSLLDLADNRRPHIARYVALALSAAAANVTIRGDGFAHVLVRLLLYFEPDLRIQEIPDDDDDDDSDQEESMSDETPSYARLCALSLVEELGGREDAGELIARTCILLLETEVMKQRSKHRSGAWGRRLRAWQALCIVAPRVSDAVVPRLEALLPTALATPGPSCVRYAVETASVAFCARFPSALIPGLLDHLDRARDGDPTAFDASVGPGRELALSSLLVVAGHAICGPPLSPTQSNCFQGPRLLRTALALQGSTRGLVRGVAQLLVLVLWDDPVIRGSFVDDASFVSTTATALKSDPDVVRTAKRQATFFTQLRDQRKCTLAGLIDAGVHEFGDEDKAHSIVTAFREYLISQGKRLAHDELHNGDARYFARERRGTTKNYDHIDDGPHVVLDEAIENHHQQRKIDEIMYLDDDDDDERRRSHTARVPVVVCASLVDKAPNIGGLARTAEVFACEGVVVPDLSIVSSAAFQAVSVTAEKWIPLTECPSAEIKFTLFSDLECPPAKLLPWLRTMRSKGYTIVALEQASNSVSLSDVHLPTPAVLLLGHEKEGLDADALALTDLCIEIPQLGVVRSLNVHVAGALAIWEFARQCRPPS